jgi:hypothetical protein|tara:strand:- start:237 stop:434 length:198 start_codon:yes stop_codon:yes gene_type:complete
LSSFQRRKGLNGIFEALGEGASCDDICDKPNAAAAFKSAASFFLSFRSLAMGAQYSTLKGWKAIG